MLHESLLLLLLRRVIVQIKLRIAVGNQRNFSGVLEGLFELDGGQVVRLRSLEAVHEFAFANIDKARLVPKF